MEGGTAGLDRENDDYAWASDWCWNDFKETAQGFLIFVHKERQRRRMSKVGVYCISSCERSLHTIHKTRLAGENILILHVPIHVNN